MASLDNLSKRGDWRDRAALYSNGSKITSQKCEDLTARRILVGLGYHEKGLPRLEASLGLAYDPSKPLFDRVRTVLEIVGGDFFSPDPTLRRFSLQCREFERDHRTIVDDVDEWVECAAAEKDGAVVVGRVKSDRVAWGYVIVRQGVTFNWLLRAPAVLIKEHNGYWIWYRELSDLIHDMARYSRWEIPGSVDFDPDDPHVYGS